MSSSRTRIALFIALLSFATGACSKAKSDGDAVATSAASGAAEATAKGAAAAAAPANVVSCHAAEGLCSEWTGLTLSELKEAQESCSDPGEKFGTTPCPRKAAFASCRHAKEKVTLFIPKADGMTMKDAKEICEDGELTPIK
jgi:hypothetical protein